MREIEQRRNYISAINLTTAATNIIDWDVFVPFIPDEVIIRYASYYDTNTTSGRIPPLIVIITSPITNDPYQAVCTLMNTNQCQPVNSHITLNKPISGEITFNILNTDFSNVTNISGAFSLHLEFIKYKKST